MAQAQAPGKMMKPKTASRRARASRKTSKKRAKRKAKGTLFGGRLPW